MSTGAVDHSHASLLVGQVENGALVVHCPGTVWISIRPSDPEADYLPSALLRLVGAIVAPNDIRDLLPHWESLSWEEIPPSDLSCGEWVTYSSGYRVNIYGDPRAPLWHRDVKMRVAAFLNVGV